MNFKEIIASLLAIAAVVGSVTLPFWWRGQHLFSTQPERTITLTGVATNGVWTEEEVNGENYHRGGFKAAQVHLNPGEKVRLILRSADVVHKFYLPQLNIGPVELIPGHTEEVHFTADKEGVYPYYCTEICGDCHFHMRGEFTVGNAVAAAASDAQCDETKHEPVPQFANIQEAGHYWFETKGCVTCHGQDGQGGVPNFNYARGTVPALNTLASKISLQSKDEVKSFTSALERKEVLAKEKPVVGISNWALTFAQYESVLKTIREGSPPLKADPNGPAPPLFMPAWKEKLSDEQINSIVAFLLSKQKFVEQSGWGN